MTVHEKESPLVSVIISFLNEEKFLSESIASVISQSYPNWELILVDDGSTDRSCEIGKKNAADYQGKIIYTDHEGHANRGLSFSRNRGIDVAKGDLIAILDADDVWLADKLNVQVNLLRQNPDAAMLCEGSVYWHYPWQNEPDQKEVIQIGKEQDRLFKPFELIKHLYPLSNGDAPVPSGIIVWRDILLKHGGFESHFTGKYQLYEDQAFLHKMYLNEFVYISSFCNHLYRQREGSLVQQITKDGEYESVRLYFLEWLEKYIEVNKLHQKDLDKLLKAALEPYRHPEKYRLKKFLSRIAHGFKSNTEVKTT